MFHINTFTSIENGLAMMVMIPVSALSQKHTSIMGTGENLHSDYGHLTIQNITLPLFTSGLLLP